MKTIALIPLRSLNDGKRRLAEVLTIDERRSLVLQLWQRAHAALIASGGIDRVAVVTPDPALIEVVARNGVQTILQDGLGLNAGLEQARDVLMADRISFRLLVVLPDLPLVEGSDIAGLLRCGDRATIAIASDRHGVGTNALLMPRPRAIPFCFGPNSLDRHVSAAIARGWAIARYDAPGTAIDLDTPDDLRSLQPAIVGATDVSEWGG